MSEIKNIAIFTSIRSEYGLLTPLIRAIEQDPSFNLQLLVGGAHLLKEYGESINQIKADGFNISGIFPFLNPADKHITHSLGNLQSQMGEYLAMHKPDLLFVLGDRFELIPVVLAALLYNIPIAHISGGETTEGAVDNQIRHAITKMAHVHFPATEIYQKNIIQMGEEAWRICVSGEPGLDEILKLNFLTKQDLFKDLGLTIDKKTICCTFHPQTIDNQINVNFVKALLLEIVKDENSQILVTASNFDQGGSEINDMLADLSNKTPNIIFVKSLGQKRYYSLLKYADLMLGNSSSGLVEAQSFNLPVINIGDRQKGRLANPNVINCKIDIDEIVKAMDYATSNLFKKKFLDQPNIYGDGKACMRIMNFLKTLPTTHLFIKKDIFIN